VVGAHRRVRCQRGFATMPLARSPRRGRERSEWRNRQTRWLEGPVPERAWGFKSPLRHELNPHADRNIPTQRGDGLGDRRPEVRSADMRSPDNLYAGCQYRARLAVAVPLRRT